MWIIRFSIENPVKITVAVLLLGLFGAISLRDMPVQMTPTVDKPEISINTSYPGAAPAEVEEQITVPIEEKLQAVEGLRRITSSSREGRSSVELEFDWGVNKDTALIDIIKRLSRVRDLPDDADEPIIVAGATSERRSIYWANLRGPMPVDKMRLLADDLIAPALERIEGVAEVRVHGGEEREIQIVVDFAALSSRGLFVKDLISALARENVNVRGGGMDVGKRRYLVRTVGLFTNMDEIRSVIVAKDESGSPVYLKDVAKVYDSFKKRDSMVKIMGRPAIALGIVKKSGSNTIAVVNDVEATMEKLNRQLAPKGLSINESYDSSNYIWESIDFVASNFAYGAILAMVGLVLFLRSFKSAILVGVSIPIVAAAGFILLNAFGRSLNIISLAGMAFAVGMVVDNSIVALENIYRHMQMGKSRKQAAMEGAMEVWGAILASTLTTLAVFTPIIYIEEEAGQLFGDIAIAISVSVAVSLIVSITVIPALAAKGLDISQSAKTLNTGVWWLAQKIGEFVSSIFLGMAARMKTSSIVVKAVVVMVIVAAALATIPLAPKMEYLPKGNRNLVFIVFKPYVGSNLETSRKYSDIIAEKVLNLPEVKYMFHVVSARFNGIGVRMKDEHRLNIAEAERKINAAIQGSAGFEFARGFQRSLFSRMAGADIEIEVKGPNLPEAAKIAKNISTELYKIPSVTFTRTDLQTGNPEFRVIIDRERAADLKLSVSDIAEVVETVVAGKRASIYKEGGDEFDITVMGSEERLKNSDAIGSVPIYGGNGKSIRLDSVAKVVESIGPSQINHIEMERSVTLSVTKKEGAPLQEVVESIEEKVFEPMRKNMASGFSLAISGSARDLALTASQLSGSLVLAVIIVYLVMAALFESFLYPLIIMVAVPLAASGAILAVRFTGSSLDILTMLGFVILTGIVVNNAILLVHQTRNYVRHHGYKEKDAVIEAVRVRIRPIFMSSATTVMGMAPLVLRGGAGSELYSGLAAAICGGLIVSTLFTLVLVPALGLILADIKERVGKSADPA